MAVAVSRKFPTDNKDKEYVCIDVWSPSDEARSIPMHDFAAGLEGICNDLYAIGYEVLSIMPIIFGTEQREDESLLEALVRPKTPLSFSTTKGAIVTARRIKDSGTEVKNRSQQV